MRHDYDSQHVNGAFVAVVFAGFLAAVAGALTIIAVVVAS